ncbi:MAG: hypothetical protein JWN07_2876 [Hyphomicrobiales bacterium]|nr:hypothetical protein [Hyphomicrobiales bacterium]
MIFTPAVPFSPAVETYQEGEAETIAKLNEAFDTILETTATDYGHAVRAVHAKAHAVLKGTIKIADNLPAELAQGLFAKPGEHQVLMRVSTNAGDILPDAVSLPRGLALKILEVEGERLPGSSGTSQDFIMVNGQVFQTKTAEEFRGNLKLLAQTTDRLEGAKVALSSVLRVANKALHAVGIESAALQSLGGAPNVDPLGETYYSVTPFRYGDFIAKFSLAPISTNLIARSGQEIDASDNENAIRDTVRAEMATQDGVWDFRVQLCRNLERQPIEDSTVLWDEDDAPFRSVATITVKAQDSWSPEAIQQIDETTRFSIWTGLAAHQPLGNINRARRDTYRHSSDFRSNFNKCPMHD